MNNREAFEAWFIETYTPDNMNRDEQGDYISTTARLIWQAWQAALASQAQQDKEANSNRLTDAQIEDIGKEILNHGTHEWEGLQPWVYVFARRIASVSEQLLGNLEEFKLSEAQQDHIPDGGKMVQQTESQWISVEERLPEMAQKVFGIYDAGMCAFMRVRSEDDTWCWAIGRNDLYDDFFYDVDDDYQVTHWMPLPPAPEGE